MNEFGEPIIQPIRRARSDSRWRSFLFILVPVFAVLLQIYLPMFISYLSYLELPLLVTVHFALTRRSPVAAIFFGAAVGIGQDALSDKPLGMFGIVKTLVGFFGSVFSMRMDVDNGIIRFLLALFFFVFHQLLYWVLARALLSQGLDLDLPRTLLFAILNAIVALPLFAFLDRLL